MGPYGAAPSNAKALNENNNDCPRDFTGHADSRLLRAGSAAERPLSASRMDARSWPIAVASSPDGVLT